jgi:adenylate cyclase
LALDCALAVEKKLAQMSPWLKERGYADIRMTMGLESGVVTVGNLGARQRRAYTIMGKSVNLASHLQQQCRQIGHDVLCGPELCRRLTGSGRIQLLPATAIRGLEEHQVIGYPAKNP